MPTVLNAADEVAVRLFLEREIPFSAIPFLVQGTLEAFTNIPVTDLDTVLEVNNKAGKIAAQLAANL